MIHVQSRFSRRQFLQGLAGLSGAVILHGCTTASENATTTATPLQIGVNVGNVPWEFRDEAGKLVGFEVDLLTEIGQRLNRPVEWVNMPFTELFPAVLSNRINAALASITITEERLKTMDFAQPYYDSDQSLTVKTDRDIRSLQDMRGKVVAVDNGSTGDTWVQAHQQEYGFADIRRYEGLNPAMVDLEAGTFDGYVSDIPALLYYTRNKPALQVVERIPTGEQYSIMFGKGNTLRDDINAMITALKQNGTLAQIYKTWFGVPPEPTTSTVTVLPVPSLT